MNAALSFSRAVTASAITIVFLLVFCGGPFPVQAAQGGEPRPERRSRPPTYHAAIQEGQTAAQEVLEQGKVSALTIALVDRRRVILYVSCEQVHPWLSGWTPLGERV